MTKVKCLMFFQYHIKNHGRTDKRREHIHWNNAAAIWHGTQQVAKQRKTAPHEHRAREQNPMQTGM